MWNTTTESWQFLATDRRQKFLAMTNQTKFYTDVTIFC